MVLGVSEVGQDSLEMEGLAGGEQGGKRWGGVKGTRAGTTGSQDERAGRMAAGEQMKE